MWQLIALALLVLANAGCGLLTEPRVTSIDAQFQDIDTDHFAVTVRFQDPDGQPMLCSGHLRIELLSPIPAVDINTGSWKLINQLTFSFDSEVEPDMFEYEWSSKGLSDGELKSSPVFSQQFGYDEVGPVNGRVDIKVIYVGHRGEHIVVKRPSIPWPAQESDPRQPDESPYSMPKTLGRGKTA